MEERAGDRGREVEDAVVGAGRVAEEHVAQHPFGDVRVCGEADEVRAELALPEVPERHVGAQDVALRAVRIGDGVQRDMRVGGLDVVGELDVGELGPPDHPFLLLGRQRVPRGQVMQVLLYDDVAAARERGVLVPHECRRAGVVTHRVLGAVDEPEQISVIEVPEPVRLVDDPDRPAQPVQQL